VWKFWHKVRLRTVAGEGSASRFSCSDPRRGRCVLTWWTP
jgi:hypothetical protein